MSALTIHQCSLQDFKGEGANDRKPYIFVVHSYTMVVTMGLCILPTSVRAACTTKEMGTLTVSVVLGGESSK